MASATNRYNLSDYSLLHEFDSLYFSGEYQHNLVCGVPVIDNKQIVKHQVEQYISEGSFRYSRVDGHPLYREAISKKLVSEGFCNKSFIATVGGTGGILLSMMSVINSGDEIIVIDPDFPAYRYLITLLGGNPIYYYLDGDFRISSTEIEKLITSKTKAIVFSNPSNPLGLITKKQTLQELVEIASAKDIWIISDEVYSDFAYERSFESILSINSDNVVCVRSLSKSGGLGGWRIGYCIGSEYLVSVMRDIQEYSFICPTVASQYVAAGVLPEINTLAKDFSSSVKQICDLLLQNNVKFIKPEAAFFVYVLAPNSSGIKFAKKCYEAGIAVLPGALFSQRDDFVRLSLAGELEKNIRAVKAFIKVYEQVLLSNTD